MKTADGFEITEGMTVWLVARSINPDVQKHVVKQLFPNAFAIGNDCVSFVGPNSDLYAGSVLYGDVKNAGRAKLAAMEQTVRQMEQQARLMRAAADKYRKEIES